MSAVKGLRAFIETAQATAKTGTSAYAGKQIVRWGLPVAAIGTGGYVVPTAVGAGIENAFGLDPVEVGKSASKISSWVIFLIVAVVFVVFLLPRIKTAMK